MGAKLYRSAMRSVAPSRAEMARRHAPHLAADRAARDAIRAEIEAGADPRALYDAENAKPDRGCRYRGAALVGVLRRGMIALD